ncbi:hypothetical protein [Maridesulfovibrio sp.]|uniref:hypothetical protein n=1 Tax=Maridesulfovibrio sp. TaxID=2795000 RepID=UPI0029F55E51|nr:hypothetical protein [Maridesulfovibrio sp.]
MGGGGGKSPSAPVSPPPAPPVAPPPAPPKMEDIGKSEQELRAKKMREMERMKKGRSATVLTGGQGDTGQLATATQNLQAQKTKLGQ